MHAQLPRIARSQARRERGTEEHLPMQRVGGFNELPRFFGNQHDGQRPHFGNTNRSQRLPITGLGMREEELQRRDERSHGIQLELFFSQQQVLPDLHFAQLFW